MPADEDEPIVPLGLGWFYNMLGTIFAFLATVSIIKSVFSLGLSPTMELVITSYRHYMDPLTSGLIEIPGYVFADWHPPSYGRDILSISIIGGCGAAKTYAMINHHMFKAPIWSVPKIALVGGILGVTLLGFLAVISALIVSPIALVMLLLFRAYDGNTDYVHFLFTFIVYLPIYTALLGAAVFFAVNAFE